LRQIQQGCGQKAKRVVAEGQQVPTWSAKDMQFFLHGSMSAEVTPEGVLRAFIKLIPTCSRQTI
jgi:hypothetical protein